MSWSEVVGQDLTTKLLQRAAATDRLAHAYLFTGPFGVGKRDAARVLAKVLNCLARPEPGECCDRCISCRNIDAGVFPDFLVVERIKGKDIKIAQIVYRERETDDLKTTAVKTFVSRKPLEGRRSVVVVAEAEQMNEAAQNALLKTLEEPPEYAHFILTTTNPNGLLPTIRSRSQFLSFPPAPTTLVAEILQRDGVPTDRARFLAALSGGSIGRARELEKDELLAKRREDARLLLTGLVNQDDTGILARAEEWERRKEELPVLLELVLFWLRDALVVMLGQANTLVLAVDALPTLQELARVLGKDKLVQMIDAVMTAQQRLERNANTRLVLDVLMFKLGSLAGSAGERST